MIDTKRIMSEETNNPKPPEDNVDVQLAVAMNEAATVIDDYVKQRIGEPAFWAYKDRVRAEHERAASLPEEVRQDDEAQILDRLDARGAYNGLERLDEGDDVATATAYGQIEAVFDIADERMEDDLDDPYIDAFDEIMAQLREKFDLYAQGDFSLISVGREILSVHLPPVPDEITEVVYHLVGGVIETRARSLRDRPNVDGPFAMGIKSFPIDLKSEAPFGSISVTQLQKDVAAVLKETVAELKMVA